MPQEAAESTAQMRKVIVDQIEALAEQKRVEELLKEHARDRERQENVFQELQHAIDYLDHAPAGFFSVDGNGDVGYVNATLAGWLDYDLAQVGSGGLRLTDLLPGDSAALLTYRAAWLRDQGANVTREAAMAKFSATENAQQVIDAAVQMWGGLGVVSGQAVEQLYREIRALRIYEGATEVQQLIIARELLRDVPTLPGDVPTHA